MILGGYRTYSDDPYEDGYGDPYGGGSRRTPTRFGSSGYGRQLSDRYEPPPSRPSYYERDRYENRRSVDREVDPSRYGSSGMTFEIDDLFYASDMSFHQDGKTLTMLTQ